MKAKRSASPVNKRNLRIQSIKPNYSDEKRKSPRNLNLIKTKVAESNLAPKPSAKKKAAINNSSNQIIQEEVDSQIEKLAANKSEALKVVLDEINLKLLSSSQQP